MHAKRAKELWERGATAVLCVGLLMLPVALHWELVWSGRIVSGVDTPQAYFPLRWLVYRMWRSGAAPWWNEYLLGGMPLAAQPDAQAWYMPGWLLFFVLSPATAFNITLMLHYGMAGVVTFLFLRGMQLSDVAALCGALSFMWCGFLTGHRVHSAMVETAIWLPGVLWGLAGWCETQRRRWLVITTATTTLQLLCGYMQIVLMTWGAAALLLVVWTCTRGLTWRAGGVAVLALLAGALLAACQVLMVWEFAKQCTRATLSYEQFCHGAYPLDELWRALFPFLNGAQWHVSLYREVPFYRGVENYAELALYAGAT
ncbi:MAG: YfhO family protein, partial [bacterium]|nr:YfhO family protein [bacterium]